MSSPISEEEFEKGNTLKKLPEKYTKLRLSITKKKCCEMLKWLSRLLKMYMKTQRDKFKRIVVPFTDGVKTIQVVDRS